MKRGLALHTYFRDIVLNCVAGSALVPRTGRYLIYRAWGIQIGTRNISAGCFVSGSNLTVGRKCFINYGCFFDATAPIVLGDGCHIGMRTLLCTSTHELGGSARRAGKVHAQPITVGRGVWLGAQVTVLGGVTIGDGCVVAAGSVVTSDCKPDSLYAGNPARRVRDLSSEEFSETTTG